MLRPRRGRKLKSQSSPGGSQRPCDSALASIALGVVFLGERVASAALLGTMLVLAGARLTSRRETRQVSRPLS
jgi:hypothetical protein